MLPTVKPSAACHSVASEDTKESGSLIIFMRRHPDCAEDEGVTRTNRLGNGLAQDLCSAITRNGFSKRV